MSETSIRIERARTNNLRGVSCEIPHGQLTVITGVSGSGKSSLAFDTLFAEGQRRFVESMSTYARQFLDRLERPDVDQISNVPPAIALEQRNSVRNARSTVGTSTEILDFLRMLFAKIGHTVCPDCGVRVQRDTVKGAAERIADLGEGARVTIAAPVEVSDKRRVKGIARELIAGGFTRLMGADQRPVDIEGLEAAALRDLLPWRVVIDRVKVSPKSTSRLAAALEQAYQVGHGLAQAVTPEGEVLSFAQAFSCTECGRAFREPIPAMLSFNSPIGACEECNGFGRIPGVDWDRVIPNPNLPLSDKPIAPWNVPSFKKFYGHVKRETNLPQDKPISAFTQAERVVLFDGEGPWPGIRGFFRYLERKKYKMHIRIMLARYRGYTPCPPCGGARLKVEGLWIKIGGKNIDDLCRMTIAELRQWFLMLELKPQEQETADSLLREIHGRLQYLDEVGLGYLTLGRQARTLSGGEAQRINLAAALGSNLTATLYVLDEPTVGLHARDTHRLLKILQALRSNGNTVAVVEHDPEVIEGADHIVDIGPHAGEHGGEVIFEGDVKSLKRSKTSLTGQWLRGEGGEVRRRTKTKKPTRFVTIHGARGNNLKNLTVKIPLRRMVCIAGVSGSGKSTLMVQTLVGNLLREQGQNVSFDVAPCEKITGQGQFDEIILVDQSPLQRSARSNPVTYTKAYDEIRRLMAASPIAKARGIEAKHFSFNTDAGRCEACEGLGYQTIDMHFMADVRVRCAMCDGKRFRPSVLEITHRGRTIAEILEMTVEEARGFFSANQRIQKALQPLVDVGLGYLRLGQSTATLSGGEAQRLKLAAHLMPSRSKKKMLFLFDEPTTGLHMADVATLLQTLERLVEEGHSVVVIEHNLDLIRASDWVIELGPEGGDAGGQLVVEGTPQTVASCKGSPTGAFLGKMA